MFSTSKNLYVCYLHKINFWLRVGEEVCMLCGPSTKQILILVYGCEYLTLEDLRVNLRYTRKILLKTNEAMAQWEASMVNSLREIPDRDYFRVIQWIWLTGLGIIWNNSEFILQLSKTLITGSHSIINTQIAYAKLGEQVRHL